MADVEISYKGNEIATMSATGVKTLLTGDTFCEDDIIVSYTKPATPTPTLQSKTVSPSTSQQTVSPDSGYDGLSSVTVNAMPSGTEGTPSATKGAVSNHAISVTPSVTNTAGYIAGGTKTGTAVTVSASELVSGTLPITENGTGIDVTNYASVDVDVSGGGGGLQVYSSTDWDGSDFSLPQGIIESDLASNVKAINFKNLLLDFNESTDSITFSNIGSYYDAINNSLMVGGMVEGGSGDFYLFAIGLTYYNGEFVLSDCFAYSFGQADFVSLTISSLGSVDFIK